MEICPPEKLTNVSHFISRGLFCNYQKDVAARRAATSMFWFKENQRPVPLIRTEVERHTTDGRMDMLIKTADYIFIIEFKLDKSADEAIQQIEDMQYAKPFEQDGRKIYKIGVNFSTKTKCIDGWKIAE